jgi:TRAP-type C4-dicarboxylate transport system permease small subunit
MPHAFDFPRLAQRVVLGSAAVTLLALPLITTYDVAMRYLFHAPTIWVTEISIYLLQFAVFTTPGALLTTDHHLRGGFWIETRSGLTRRLAEIVTTLAILPYAAILLWFGATYTLRALDRGMLSPTLPQVPLWIVYALLPLGGELLVMGVVQKCLTEWPAPNTEGPRP